ncbi:membrane protein insertase YidC [Colwellia sp. 4_MG-2023]|uniref:membrane protein insertase YidC n=1 Tax=unclassified Colwellia TaxID=196834 RepID=UPI001C090A45|nr:MULTISPECIES: membrane protein insertase YidC [unclassified Colwellia]MBU2923516.1 membrane protein insertase YidC [Colwellia sp. C2M11]MDO6486089.1 membrane protein insertase YidC [Colwellia sp. 6_MG-2023]MDO6505954.1 membrane protein insertase YidC [Colwellia sp. 5_MG-2023]MDO6554635.1 membrane protein insertase YidC [Colwellia sp. 4_MG-2023]MDO6653310.1 membrane protein insertase YidC [Colwellia sp. 3_MG-2023]
MESQRSLLFIALMVVTYLLFSQWQAENSPAVEQPTISQNANNELAADAEFVPESTDSSAPMTRDTASNAKLISIATDTLLVKINTQGGDIVDAKLLDFNTEQGNNIPYTVMQNGNQKYVAQSGLTGANGVDRVIKGRPIYSTVQSNYELVGDNLTVDLTFQDNNGLSVTKRFSFVAGSYSIGVEYIINNSTANSVSVQMYGQLKQSTLKDTSSGMLPTYRGAAFSTSEDRYEKYDFDDIAETNLNKTTPGGWVAMLEHYFVSAWVPNAEDNNQLYTNYSNNQEAVIGFKAPPVTIDAGQQGNTSAIFYVGPKDQAVLEKIAPNLDLTIDYGFLWMISQPLFWLLLTIQSFVTNWGVAIIIITLIVKGGMYPLTKAQYTSMAKMRELAPKMAQLKERFGDDRQKMSQATMEMYRKEKVNPAGGCLPLLLQMPIFLALYWVFLESVELRHAPFVFWIQDLSAMDPYYVLPVLMGISMFVMQKMQPMTIQDPMQQKIMQYMPVVFSIFMAWFPSGLVLYWFVSNMISIAQMKVIFSGIEKKKLEKAS